MSKIITTTYLFKKYLDIAKHIMLKKNEVSFHGIDVHKSTYVKKVKSTLWNLISGKKDIW